MVSKAGKRSELAALDQEGKAEAATISEVGVHPGRLGRGGVLVSFKPVRTLEKLPLWPHSRIDELLPLGSRVINVDATPKDIIDTRIIPR